MYAYCGVIEETAEVDMVNERLEWC